MYKLIKQRCKRHKKLKYVIVVCVCLIYSFHLCLSRAYHIDNHNSSQIIKRNAQNMHEPIRGRKNIFFIETSCFNQTREHEVNPRQACAIESSARANPDHKVYLLHTCEFNRFNLPLEDDYLTRLLFYTNVRFLRLNVTRFVQETPIEDWWKTGGMKNSLYPVVHVSDVLRLLTLWKYGGTYMDLDFIVLKSLRDHSNFIGAESWYSLANGMMNFEADGIGHEIVTECLEDIKRTFNGSVWAGNGPSLVTRVLQRTCNVTMLMEMTKDRCGGFFVFPPKVFYPIPWAFWLLYFAKEDPITKFPFSLMKESLAVHVWNKLSGEMPLIVGSNSTYGLLAEQYCPEVYKHCGSVF